MTATATIQSRMTHPAVLIPDAMKAMHALAKAAENGGVPATTRYLVHLRASQINGCSACSEIHSREMRQAGESDQRIWTVAAWREAPFFTEAERAALALTEAVTRLPGPPPPAPAQVSG